MRLRLFSSSTRLSVDEFPSHTLETDMATNARKNRIGSSKNLLCKYEVWTVEEEEEEDKDDEEVEEKLFPIV